MDLDEQFQRRRFPCGTDLRKFAIDDLVDTFPLVARGTLAADNAADKWTVVEKRLAVLENEMAKALEKGGFETNGGVLGPAWDRAKKKDKKMAADYKLLGRDYTKQREFRMNWVKVEYGKITRTRSSTKTIRNVESKVGKYMSAVAILEKEGAGKSGVARTKSYLWKCVRLQGRLVSYDTGKNSLDFLYIEEGHREEFEEAWTLLETQGEEQVEDTGMAAGSGVAGNDVKKGDDKAQVGKGEMVEEKTGNSDEENEEAPNARGTPGGAPPANRGRIQVTDEEKEAKTQRAKSIADAMTTASAAREAYNAVIGNYTVLMDSVQKDTLWAWANNDEALKLVRLEYQKVLDSKNGDVFYSTWLSSEPSALRKAHEKKMDVLVENIKKKLAKDKLPKLVEGLGVALETMKAMHNARPEVRNALAVSGDSSSAKVQTKRRKKEAA